jgi:chromosome segregation ATPase
MPEPPRTLNPYLVAHDEEHAAHHGEEHADEVRDLRARLEVAQRVLERYRSDKKQRDAELRQRDAELKECEVECTQLSDWYEAKHKECDELKQKRLQTIRENAMLQDELEHMKKYMDDRGEELRDLETQNMTLQNELAKAKAEVETLKQRMQR